MHGTTVAGFSRLAFATRVPHCIGSGRSALLSSGRPFGIMLRFTARVTSTV